LYGVTIRRPLPRDTRGQNKYISLKGSRKCLYGRERATNTLLIVEGYFDCLLAAQEMGDMVDVATMNLDKPKGSQWVPYIMGYDRILVCLDSDQAGEEGWQRWSWLGTARRVRLPAGKDITAAVVDYRVDLRDWLASAHAPEHSQSSQMADTYLTGLALAAEQERIGELMWASANADAPDRDEWVATFRAHADTWRRWRDTQTGERAAIAQRLDQELEQRLLAQMDAATTC
jgi:hypothetical protein